MSVYYTENPATGERIAEFETLPDNSIPGLIDRAWKGHHLWRDVPLAQRADVLSRIADLYEERAEQITSQITVDMGKPVTAAYAELKTTTNIFRYYADNAESLLADENIDVQGPGTAMVRKQAIGPLLGIMPWNFPHYQVARFVAPNLLLGNTIMLKHSGNCAQSALLAAELFHDAGVPEDVYQNAFITHDQVSAIIEDPRLQGVSLTGSDRAGSIVGQQAGRNVKKAVLELGGSDPFIVLEDADVATAAQEAAVGRCFNGGQVCTASKRFIVVDAIYDDFLAQFLAAMAQIQPSDPTLRDTMLGPMSSQTAVEELHELVTDAIDNGAQLELGGTRFEGPGAWYPPTVLTNVTRAAGVYYKELFGPVAVVHRVANESEAIELANDNPYGLSSSVYSADHQRAELVGDKLATGMVWINSTSKSAPELPFGGVKASGIGRELGRFGVEEFANHKMIRTPHA